MNPAVDTFENSPGSAVQFFPFILAGGSGTRFWPRSRRTMAKQVLPLDGNRTMIQQTADRLRSLASADQVYVIANDGIANTIRDQLPMIDFNHLICEPAARNTAPACGLAAFLIARTHPDAIIGMFPSDHVVAEESRFVEVLQKGIDLAQTPDTIVVLGVPPSHPETGYGYIETLNPLNLSGSELTEEPVQRFTEKPDLATATEFVASGRFVWNSGVFLWSARTLRNAIHEHAPELAASLDIIAHAYGTPQFEAVFQAIYPSCENISIDYAVLEPRSAKESNSGIYCLPADFGWNDLGSWSALHEHRRSQVGSDEQQNVIDGKAAFGMDAERNYVYAPDRFVALLGVEDLIVVVTDDAVLVTTHARAQDVGRVVKHLTAAGEMQLT